MHATRARPVDATFSEGDWSRVISTLQGNYSQVLYGHEGRVDADALSLIWLPLITKKTLDFLMCMGVCAWEPVPARTGRELLPLHAPFSTVAPGAAVWRYYSTPTIAVPSHGWIEVAHASRWNASDGVPWFYVARGSGVSLNVGRTVAVTQFPNCTKPDPRRNPEAYRMVGVDLSQLDSVQLLDVCDPADSQAWKPRGFRHEIVLLGTDLLSEGSEADSLLDAALAAHIPPVPTEHRGLPTIMCGSVPHLFACTGKYPPLQLMQGSPHVCSDRQWRGLIRQCATAEVRRARHWPLGLDKACRAEDVPLLASACSAAGSNGSSASGTVASTSGVARTINLPCANCGVIMAAIAVDAAAGSKYAREAADAVRLLRHIMQPALPLALFANACFRSLLGSAASLWDEHRSLRLVDALRPFAPAGFDVPENCDVPGTTGSKGVILRGGALRGDHPLKKKAFVLKMSALLSTEFERTLFLDVDVFVLSPGLVHELLVSALHVSDVAMPGPVPERHLLVSAAVTQLTRGVPMLCSCMMAYRSTPPVMAWVRDAARGILRTERPELMRQGDQEYLWLQRVENETHARLRVLSLSDDYYCPSGRIRVETGAKDRSPRHLAADVTIGGQNYACHSVHGHGVSSDTLAGVLSPKASAPAQVRTTKFAHKFGTNSDQAHRHRAPGSHG